MKYVWITAIIASAIGLSQFVSASDDSDQIALISVDSSGNSVEKMVDSALFKSTMSKAISTVQDSFQTALDQKPTINYKPCLELQTIGVGISLTGNLGLGPVLSLSATPHIRMIFTNSPNPVYPD